MIKTKSLRRTLVIYTLLVSLVSSVFYGVLISTYTDIGITKIFDSILRVEARSFEREYRRDPTISREGSGTIKFFLDSWQGAPSYMLQFPPVAHMQPDTYYNLEYPDEEFSFDNVFDGPPERETIAYCHLLPDGRKLIVVSDIEISILTESELQEFDNIINSILVTSLCFSLISLGLLLYFSRHLFQQTNILTNWVEQLTIENIEHDKPTLRYSEFGLIADRLQQSMLKIADMVKKEHLLLRNISHELRTPITVINTNLSLLNRASLPAISLIPVQRIERANKSMQLMTETLLWVHRESNTPPKREMLNPALIVQQQLEQYRYLLKGKSVSLAFKIETEQPIAIYQSPFEIIVGNLIRNALQYTEEGVIVITLASGSLSIENQYQQAYQAEQESFGLGISLVQQICDKLHWHFSTDKSESGFKVTLHYEAVEELS